MDLNCIKWAFLVWSISSPFFTLLSLVYSVISLDEKQCFSNIFIPEYWNDYSSFVFIDNHTSIKLPKIRCRYNSYRSSWHKKELKAAGLRYWMQTMLCCKRIDACLYKDFDKCLIICLIESYNLYFIVLFTLFFYYFCNDVWYFITE